MSTLELRHLNKRYAGGDWAVRDLSVVVDDGEFFVIVGPSGCGKSTVLRMVAGLEQLTGGDVLIDGRNVNAVPSNERDVAMAFQDHALYPHMTVAENIGFPMWVDHVHHSILERRIQETASALQLTDVLHLKPARLSGGQRQRTALGRAIVRNPRVLLMDEPMSQLDAKLRTQTRAVITGMQRRLGVTTVYVTHDHDEAMAMGDRLAVMRSGRVEQCGIPMDVYERPRNLFVAHFVGTPSMNIVRATVTVANGAPALQIGPHLVPLDDGVALPRPRWQRMVGQDIALGVRPESLRPDPAGQLVGSVRSTEIVERRKWVTFDLDAPAVTATAGGVAVRSADRSVMVASVDLNAPASLWEPFRVTVDAEHLYAFDLTSGDALD